MAVDTSDFRNGMHFYLDGEVYTVVEFQHVKPGKGGAFVRTKLRKVKTGQTLEKTFRSGERVEPAFVEKFELHGDLAGQIGIAAARDDRRDE